MSILSDKLKSKRKEKGFSQKTLSEGICEQSQISKIERGNYMPAADLLYKLANRLQVPLDYFFDEQIEITSNITPFKKLAEKLLEDRNYEDLEYLLNLEKKSLSIYLLRMNFIFYGFKRLSFSTYIVPKMKLSPV